MDRCIGSLLALAVGDTLGAATDGLKDGHILQVFGEIAGYPDPIAGFSDRPGKWRLRGLYTARTQQALAAAEVLAVYDAPDPAALAGLFTRLLHEGTPGASSGIFRGPGHFFRRAVQRMAEGAEALATGQPSAGNGACSRGAVVGLYYRDADDETLARAVIELSLPTHNDPRAIAAALAVAHCVARFAASGDAERPAPLALAEELGPWLREQEEFLAREYGRHLDPNAGRDRLHHMSRVLETLPSLVRERDDALASRTIVGLANDCDPDNRIAQPQAGFAPASVTAALYRALTQPGVEPGLLAVVHAGGETSAAAAIAGAILGARFGGENLPEQWVAGLLNAAQVRVRAEALRDHEVNWAAWEDLVEMEKALSENEEHALRKALAAHGKEIAKRTQRLGDQRQRAAAHKTAPHLEPGFAPLPAVWIGGAPTSGSIAIIHRDPDADPIQAKRDRALRGRKRIGWKEERRGKAKIEGPENDNAAGDDPAGDDAAGDDE